MKLNPIFIVSLFLFVCRAQDDAEGESEKPRQKPVKINAQQAIKSDKEIIAVACGHTEELSSQHIPLRVALGPADFKGLIMTEMCGQCINVKGPKGSVTATVVSQCGSNCPNGTIMVNSNITDVIYGGNDKLFPVEWKIVDCPVKNITDTIKSNQTALETAREASKIIEKADRRKSEKIVNIRAVVSVLNFAHCPKGKKGPAVKAPQLESMLFKNSDPKAYTLISQAKFCSRGQLLVSPESRVVEISPPCNMQPDLECSLPDTYEAEFELDKLTDEKLKQNGDSITNYNGRYYVSDKTCDWLGEGSVGVYESTYDNVQAGRVILYRNSWKLTATWVHEIGHNLGLLHANAKAGEYFDEWKDSEYADLSSIMGFNDVKNPCPNLAHMSILGWADPPTLDMKDLKNQWKEFKFTSNDVSPGEGVEINDAKDPKVKWYVSARSNGKNTFYGNDNGVKSTFPNDESMPASYAGNVHIHKLEKDQSTMLLSILKSPGQMFSAQKHELHVKFVNFEGQKATVQVCSSAKRDNCK